MSNTTTTCPVCGPTTTAATPDKGDLLDRLCDRCDRPISTAGLTAAIRRAITDYEATARKNRVRAITADEAAYYAGIVRKAARLFESGDEAIVLRSYGGYVPGSYRYRAEADVLTVTVTREGYTVEIIRGTAPRRPHGRGALTLARIRRPGQSQGRLVVTD